MKMLIQSEHFVPSMSTTFTFHHRDTRYASCPRHLNLHLPANLADHYNHNVDRQYCHGPRKSTHHDRE